MPCLSFMRLGTAFFIAEVQMRRILVAILALVAVAAFSAGALAAQGALTVKLTDRLGTSQTVDLAQLPQLTYPASYKRSSGTIVGPFTYTGPSLNSVLALMGGINKGDAVQLIAGDGYRMSLTYEQVNGEVTVYNEKGEALEEFTRPIMVLATSSDNPAFDGIRAIYSGPADPLTDGHTWVKDIVEVRVIPMVKEWMLELKGAVSAKMDRSTFESLATCPASPHPGEQHASTTGSYAGTPLWTLVSVVDNVEPENSHYTFDRGLAANGYTVRVKSADGSFLDIKSQDMADDGGYIVAFTKDGHILGDDEGPLVLTGPKVQKTIFRIVSIELIGLGN